MSTFILKRKTFDTLDDVYEEDLLRHSKARQKEHKGNGTAAGIVLGMMGGGAAGALTHNPVAALGLAGAGAIGGGILGYKQGKKQAMKEAEDAERKLKRYKASSKEDKKELRDREMKDQERRENRRNAGMMAMSNAYGRGGYGYGYYGW